MARIPIPCRAERYTAKGGPDTWWPTPEPPHRIDQIYLEPVLFACAAATPRLRILSRTRVSDFEQCENGVSDLKSWDFRRGRDLNRGHYCAYRVGWLDFRAFAGERHVGGCLRRD